MATDFTTWDRATLEQFAREARDKLVAIEQVKPMAFMVEQYGHKKIIFDDVVTRYEGDEIKVTPLYTSATTIPEGYALVPVDPTKEMIIAGEMQIGRHAYKAMLSAAPKHEPTEAKEEK